VKHYLNLVMTLIEIIVIWSYLSIILYN